MQVDDEETEKLSARGGIQVIERAARILRALKPHQYGLSLTQIAQEVELPRSTVQRIVNALMAEGLVMTGPRGRSIRLGPEIADLARQNRRNVVESCRLILSELSHSTGETADLSILQGNSMIFIDQIPGVHRLRTASAVGDAFPLTTTANGTACLALLPVDDAMSLAKAEWKRWGVAPDPETFANRLRDIRSSGLAYDLGDHTDGISAIGIAFHDRSGALYSISVPVPSSRFDEVRDSVEAALTKTREQAAKQMSED